MMNKMLRTGLSWALYKCWKYDSDHAACPYFEDARTVVRATAEAWARTWSRTWSRAYARVPAI